jgi:hypothetical protein
MVRPGATHRAAPSCTPATRDRTGQLHRDVHGLPAASRNPGLLDESGLAPASRPRTARGPPIPAGSPAILEPGPRARRHPGVQARLPFTLCAMTSMSSTTRGTIPMRQARRTGTPAHRGNPGRPCRRQMRTYAQDDEFHGNAEGCATTDLSPIQHDPASRGMPRYLSNGALR